MAVRAPRQLLQQFGLHLPHATRIITHDSTAEMRYMVLPMRPEVLFIRDSDTVFRWSTLNPFSFGSQGTDGWTEEQLRGLVTRDCMIGTQLPLKPS
jgi:nitrile hydratase